jgi:uncharacterized protein YndB with AHSA1/START domain
VIPNIEREILIEAPVEVVWRAVTEPDQISSWFSDAADLELKTGYEGTLTFNDRATKQPMTVHVTVQAVETGRTFSYRWLYPDGAEPRDGNSMLVEFTLTAEGETTRLRVVESGLSALGWPDDQKATYAQEHTGGWIAHLDDLREYLAPKARA